MILAFSSLNKGLDHLKGGRVASQSSCCWLSLLLRLQRHAESAHDDGNGSEEGCALMLKTRKYGGSQDPHQPTPSSPTTNNQQLPHQHLAQSATPPATRSKITSPVR